MNFKFFTSICLVTIQMTFGQNNANEQEQKKKIQDAIIEEFATNGAQKYDYNYQMAEWQNSLDNGLKKDSTIAYLWQQKAMPYFKAKKYEIGMKYIDKAVHYNPERWQSYRAFIKCIFAKTYKEAIVDFEDCKKKFGNNYVMDHTYNFYIGLSFLQLNEFSNNISCGIWFLEEANKGIKYLEAINVTDEELMTPIKNLILIR